VDLSRELVVAAGDASVALTVPAARAAEASFDAWVREASPALLRFARTTRSVDAVDLVQDALVAVFTRWSRLSEPGAADAYARRVILNSHVSRWRAWGRRVSTVDPAVLTAAAPAGAATGSGEVLLAHQLLAGLPTAQRAAVFMRFYDDLTYRQIAEVIGCREATARSYVHRALTQLRTQLDQEPPS